MHLLLSLKNPSVVTLEHSRVYQYIMVSMKLVAVLFITLTILATMVTSQTSKKHPCGKNREPLKDVFYGRGPTREDCPTGYECVIAPDDTYAVCCSTRHSRGTTTAAPSEKPGSCPPPSTLFGICVVNCDDNFSCEGNQKCCGSCPRQCVSPVL